MTDFVHLATQEITRELHYVKNSSDFTHFVNNAADIVMQNNRDFGVAPRLYYNSSSKLDDNLLIPQEKYVEIVSSISAGMGMLLRREGFM